MSKSRPSPAVAVLSGILLMVILIACREDPATPRVPTTTPTPTATQTLVSDADADSDPYRHTDSGANCDSNPRFQPQRQLAQPS